MKQPDVVFNPKEVLDKHLTHSTKISDIDVNLNTKALRCGFPSLEYYEYLLEGEGNLIVMAGRPGNCKTALACQIGLNTAEHGKVLFFSLEMKKETLRKRLLAVTSGVPIKKLSEPVFRAKIDLALDKQSKLKFNIIDDGGLTINDIIAKTYDENNRETLSLVVIDYIGIIKVDNTRRATSLSEVVTRIKKEIADKLKIPVIVLAQMKRGFEDRYARAKMEYEKAKQYPTGSNSRILDIRPSLEDLGESSGLEHAADVVMFLQRPFLLDPSHNESDFRVFVAKNRNGEVKDFDLEFSSTLTKFIDHGGVI